MIVLADTSAWSRYYRNDVAEDDPVADAVEQQVDGRELVTTGVVYLELLRGFTRPPGRATIESDFASLRFIEPSRADYAGAADLSVSCRKSGVQLDTIDALIAQICISQNLQLLTADQDFVHAANHIPLNVWTPA